MMIPPLRLPRQSISRLSSSLRRCILFCRLDDPIELEQGGRVSEEVVFRDVKVV